jgi:hypothetical protein
MAKENAYAAETLALWSAESCFQRRHYQDGVGSAAEEDRRLRMPRLERLRLPWPLSGVANTICGRNACQGYSESMLLSPVGHICCRSRGYRLADAQGELPGRAQSENVPRRAAGDLRRVVFHGMGTPLGCSGKLR